MRVRKSARRCPCRLRPRPIATRSKRSTLCAGCSACCREVNGMAQVKCAYCGKVINRKPSQIKRSAASYCSPECHRQAMKKGTTVQCDWCGKPFYKPPSAMRSEANLCSAACRDLWLGRRNVVVMNKPGHSKGHKAPHLTRLNCKRNPAARLATNPSRVSSYRYRKIAERKIGRKLRPGEVVHHINGNRSDNRPENLQVMTRSEHSRLHMMIAVARDKGGDALCQKK